MSYPTIFDPIPWKAVGLTAIHTFVIYWIVLLGLKLIGRRVFGELGPQDLILLLLISEATDLGLVHQEAGFLGTLTAVLMLLITVGMTEHIPALRRLMENNPIVLKKNGQLLEPMMSKHMVEHGDLDKIAHDYGMPDHTAFDTMILEDDGTITGVLKSELRPPFHHAETSPKAGI